MAIKIKPSHRGLLHKNLGVKEGEKIPASKLKVKSTDSPAVKKRKVFAQNAKKWHHGQDGLEMHGPATIKPDVPQPQARIEQINGPKPMSWERATPSRPINWGQVMNMGLLGIDALIPPEKSRVSTVYPQPTYNQYPYGTGSQAIYDDGGCMNCGGEMKNGGLRRAPKISKTGYRHNSKDRNEPSLQIPSNQISMQGVDHPVLGVDNQGNSQMMEPGGQYAFSGDYVTEYPMRQPNRDTFTGINWNNQSMENGGTFPFGSFRMPTPAQSVPKFNNGGYSDGSWILPTGVETPMPYSKNMMEYTHGGTMGENLQRDIYPSGVIKTQRERYSPNLFQVGGIIPGLTGTMYSRGAYHPTEKITETMMADDGSMIPYGNYMMQMGGNVPTYKTQAEVEAANMQAKNFTRRQGLPNWQNMRVAERVGDPMVPYTDMSGKPVQATPTRYAPGTVTSLNKIPSSVTSLEWGDSPQPYYLNESGDPIYTTPDIFHSTRFNPNRGMNANTAKTPLKATGEPVAALEYGGDLDEAKGGWIAKAASSIKRRGTEGKCTPITKPGCTGRAKALAKTFKKIARNRKHKAEDGLAMEKYYEEGSIYDIHPNEVQHLLHNSYDVQLL